MNIPASSPNYEAMCKDLEIHVERQQEEIKLLREVLREVETQRDNFKAQMDVVHLIFDRSVSK